jgi:hypothetical protein
MRICILTPDRPAQGLNGPRRVADESSRGLASLGHEVHLIGYAASASAVEYISGVWSHRVEIVDRGLPGLERSAVDMDLYAAVAKYQEVLRLHASAPVDLVVATIWPGEGLVCLLDERLATATVLVTPVKLQVDRQLLRGEPFETMTRVERAVVERSSYVHRTTSAIAADTEQTFGISLPQSEDVPLFIADRAGSPGVERYATPEETEVLFVGRPEPRKGSDVLVAAARRLASECPAAVYVLVGQGNWDALRAEVEADASLRTRVRFLCEVDEARLWRLYAGADVVCVPSRYESFGYALIEAMMFGKPLVATSVGGMPATVDEGGNALLCSPDDPESLSLCLAQLIKDPDLRKRYGLRSRELYEERYSADRGAQRTAELYAGMAADHLQAHGLSQRAPEARDLSFDVPPAGLADSLATAVMDIAGLEPNLARRVAGELLDGTTDDHLRQSNEHAQPPEAAAQDWETRALEAERQNAGLRATLDTITRSNSWRLTRPLRDLRGRERRVRRGK